MTEDIKKAYIRLRSSKGHWFVDPQLRPKLVEEAHAKDTSMTEVVVMILCDHLKIQHVPNGRRANPQPNEELLNLRLPGYVFRALKKKLADTNSDMEYQDFIRQILCKRYGLKSYPARGAAAFAPA